MGVLAVDHKRQQIYKDHRSRHNNLHPLRSDRKGPVVQHLHSIGNTENKCIGIFAQRLERIPTDGFQTGQLGNVAGFAGFDQLCAVLAQQAVMGSVNSIVLKKIGYVQGLQVGTQTDKTKWWIFALGTGIPIITSSLGIIPKLFYPLSAEVREKMYEDLQERRASMAEFMKTATKEEIDAIAEKQLQGQFE